MKIGIVYHQFISQGGLEKYLVGFVRALVGKGHDVEVVTARADEATRACGAGVLVLPGGRVKTASEFEAFDQASWDEVKRLGMDTVFGFGRTTRQDVHRAGGGCHKVYSKSLLGRRKYTRKNRVELKLEEELYTGGGTGRFIVNAAKVKAELETEYGVESDKISVVRTPVDTVNFAPDAEGAVRERLREFIGTAPGRKVLLYAGREHRRKGLHTLINAAAKLDAEVWVAGPKPKLITYLTSPGTVRYLGERSDMADIYRAADWFVHPTTYDACANTVLQSMATGLPGIISTKDGASELVEDGQSGLLLDDPMDEALLTKKLEQALAMPDAEREAMSLAARESMMPLTWKRHLKGWGV
ncbi:glycosyltransferase family 4 protein [Verrucomicrobiales bacterium]|nr:glycosyltransferase family 4 protein [Verrucomicrobiales bacterium]